MTGKLQREVKGIVMGGRRWAKEGKERRNWGERNKAGITEVQDRIERE